MKYLIQNRKEFAITVGVFVTSAVNLIRALKHGIISEEAIVAFIVSLFALLGWYFNIPTSEENCIYTGLMREEKKMHDELYIGEDFSDPEDEEVDVDE